MTSSLADTVLPVGRGFYVGANAGITPGIPVYASEEATIYVVRIDKEHVKITYRDRAQMGADFEVGAGASLGKKRVKGQKGYGAGLDVAAQAGAGMDAVVIQEYVVPLDSLGSHIFQQVLQHLGQSGSGGPVKGTTFEDAFAQMKKSLVTGGELDEYQKKRKVEFGVFGEANAEGSIGVRDNSATDKERVDEHGLIEDDPDSARATGEGLLAHGSKKYTTTGDRPVGRPGPRVIPDAQGGKTATTDWAEQHAAYLLNKIISPSFRAAQKLRLSFGYEQVATVGGTDFHESEIKIFVEGENVTQFPLIGPLPVIGQLGGGAAIVLKLTTSQEGTSMSDLRVQLYAKSGDLDMYSGDASETTLSFDIGKMFTQTEVEDLLLTGTVPGLTAAGLATRVAHSAKGVTFRKRFLLGGQMMGPFSAFVRRQGGTRVLIGDTKKWRDAVAGLDASGYVTATFRLAGPDLVRLAELVAASASDVAGKAQEGASDRGLAGAYEALSSYLSAFGGSQQFAEMEQLLLDTVQVTEAELRFSLGAGVAGQAKLKAVAGGRISGYGEAGVSCQHDLLAGGDTTLRGLAALVGSILSHPCRALPDCEVLQLICRHMYETVDGGEGDGGRTPGPPPEESNLMSSGTGGGATGLASTRGGTDKTGGAGPSGTSPDSGDADGAGNPAREPIGGVVELSPRETSEAVQDNADTPPVSASLVRLDDRSGRTYALTITIRAEGRIFRTSGITMRELDRTNGSVRMELASQNPILVTPPDLKKPWVLKTNVVHTFKESDIVGD